MIKVGDTFEHKVSYSQEQVNTFAEISGDKNPIHIDPEFAKTTPFGRPIVHGIFSASVFSKVFGMLFPGPGTIYMGQNLKFTGPVFIGEEYIAKFVVTKVRTDKHMGFVDCTLESKEGKVVIVGDAVMKHAIQFVEE